MMPAPDTTPILRVLDGHAIGVHVPHAADRRAVDAILGAFAAATPGQTAARAYSVVRDPASHWEIHAGDTRTHQAATLEDALLALEWQLVTDMLAGVHDRLHLHGSALADPSGTLSVLVLGESGAGKTTLTLALMAQGFSPFSDDVVLIDPATMSPGPFERAFHVDAHTRALVGALPHPPAWEVPGLPDGYFMPARWGRGQAPVGAILFPRHRGSAEPLLVGLTVAEAAAALLGFSGTLEHSPALALRMAARLTAAAPCYALCSGPLGATAEFLAMRMAELASARGARG